MIFGINLGKHLSPAQACDVTGLEGLEVQGLQRRRLSRARASGNSCPS